MKEILINTKKGLKRSIIKIKHPNFQEKIYHEAKKWETKNENNNYSFPPYDLLTWEMNSLITENRLQNTISKIGFIDKKDREKLQQLFDMLVLEVEEELKDNQSELRNKLSEEEKLNLTLSIKTETQNLIKNYFHLK